MQTVMFVVVCFLGAWLLAYLDHRAKFIELFFDIPGLIFLMFMAGGVLYLLYGLLKLAFEP